MYKHIAKSYNSLHKEEQLKKLELIRKSIKLIPPLLDIGCGTGISTNYFADVIKGRIGLIRETQVALIGIDNCKEMLKEGKKNYNNLIYARAENLPFPAKSFNTIISVTSFHNFKNMEKALKEIRRVSTNNNIAISFLKRSKKLEEFRTLLKKYYKFKEIEEDKDIIFIITKTL